MCTLRATTLGCLKATTPASLRATTLASLRAITPAAPLRVPAWAAAAQEPSRPKVSNTNYNFVFRITSSHSSLTRGRETDKRSSQESSKWLRTLRGVTQFRATISNSVQCPSYRASHQSYARSLSRYNTKPFFAYYIIVEIQPISYSLLVQY